MRERETRGSEGGDWGRRESQRVRGRGEVDVSAAHLVLQRPEPPQVALVPTNHSPHSPRDQWQHVRGEGVDDGGVVESWW